MKLLRTLSTNVEKYVTLCFVLILSSYTTADTSSRPTPVPVRDFVTKRDKYHQRRHKTGCNAECTTYSSHIYKKLNQIFIRTEISMFYKRKRSLYTHTYASFNGSFPV